MTETKKITEPKFAEVEMTKRQIPQTVTNQDVIKYLNNISGHIESLEAWHGALVDLAKNADLNETQKELLKNIIKSYNNLDSQWKQLTPSIQEAFATGRVIINYK